MSFCVVELPARALPVLRIPLECIQGTLEKTDWVSPFLITLVRVWLHKHLFFSSTLWSEGV